MSRFDASRALATEFGTRNNAAEPADKELMLTVTTSHLRRQLRTYLDHVQSGETVVILHRGQPVAKMEPISIRHDPTGHIADLVRSGALLPATKTASLDLLRLKPLRSRKSIVKTLLEERCEGR